MFKLFEMVMALILAYMALVLYRGTAAPPVMGMLLLVQGIFWVLDFAWIRPGESEVVLPLDPASSLSRG